VSDIVILGAGGHGREALDILRSAGSAVKGFLDENPKLHGTDIDGLRVLGGLGWLEGRRDVEALIAIGRPAIVLELAGRLAALGIRSPRALSPAAVVSPRASLGAGCLLFPQSFVSAGAALADHVTLNVGASVSHDASVGRGSLLNPGARLAGGVVVGPGAMIGMGAQVIQGKRIGAGATIGAGAVVIDDIPDGATAVGVPARVIKPS
jgi:sugar O-acyltransferase (sialic acid O-acetyltransferase NeuD family)